MKTNIYPTKYPNSQVYNAKTRPMVSYMARLGFEPAQDDSFTYTSMTEDGHSDGHIGFKGAVKNMGKGIFNFMKSTTCTKDGELDIKQTAKTFATALGVTTACLMIPGASTAFAIFGIGMALAHIISSGIEIAYADNDADAEYAWQNMGASLFEGGLAIYGAKKIHAMKDVKEVGVDISNQDRLTILFNKFMAKLRKRIQKPPSLIKIQKELLENLSNGARTRKQIQTAETAGENLLAPVDTAQELDILPVSKSDFIRDKMLDAKREYTAAA